MSSPIGNTPGTPGLMRAAYIKVEPNAMEAAMQAKDDGGFGPDTVKAGTPEIQGVEPQDIERIDVPSLILVGGKVRGQGGGGNGDLGPAPPPPPPPPPTNTVA